MYDLQKVDYTLRVFRLIPDSFTQDEKIMLYPFIDDENIIIRLLANILERRVLTFVTSEDVKKDDNIRLCISLMGFQAYYTQKFYEPFEYAIKNNKPTAWQIMKLTEWIQVWLESIAHQAISQK